MANLIIANDWSFTKRKGSKIGLANQKQEVSIMVRRSLLDTITPAQRLAIPFKYRWLKFKMVIFGSLIKGVQS